VKSPGLHRAGCRKKFLDDKLNRAGDDYKLAKAQVQKAYDRLVEHAKIPMFTRMMKGLPLCADDADSED
jgi:hypothetical protein